jgi:biopolymer transport protein ExbB/TolQ
MAKKTSNKLFEESHWKERFLRVLIPVVLGAGLTVATGFLAIFLGRTFSGDDSVNRMIQYASNVITHRGSIPYIELIFFWIAIIILIMKDRDRSREMKLFRQVREKWNGIQGAIMAGKSAIPISQSRELLRRVEQLPEILRQSKVGNRLGQAVRRFDKTKSSKEVDDILNTLSDIDSSRSESSFSGLRFFAWLIPTLGFIGTVIGIGLGIAGFGLIIENASSFTAVRSAIPTVTRNLGIAFDTTLLALFLTGILMAIMASFQKKEENMLIQMDSFCVEEIAGAFEESEPGFADLGAKMDIQTGVLNQLLKTMTDAGAPKFDLTPVENKLAEIRDGLCSSGTNGAPLQERIDVPISQISDRIVEGIRESSAVSILEKELGEIKEVARKSSQDIKDTFSGIQDAFGEASDRLDKVTGTLKDFIEKGGIQDATEFAKGVNDLGRVVGPMTDALEELGQSLQGLADAGESLKQMSVLVDKLGGVGEKFDGGVQGLGGAASEFRDVKDAMQHLTADLKKVISDNQIILAEVKSVLKNTTISIEDLSEVIGATNRAVAAVQQAIEAIAKHIRRGE